MENPETPVRILVVDDEPDIRNILHILLSSRGSVRDWKSTTQIDRSDCRCQADNE